MSWLWGLLRANNVRVQSILLIVCEEFDSFTARLHSSAHRYLTYFCGIFKVEREEERRAANSKVGGFVWLCCSLRNNIRGRRPWEVSDLRLNFARRAEYCACSKQTKKETAKQSIFLSGVCDTIIRAFSHGDVFFISLFTQRGLFSKLVGSLRRNRRPNTGRENIELGNMERRRNRAYTSDARLNVAR